MAETGEEKLAGKTVVLTGSRLGMSRDEAKDLVEAAGGKVSGSVSKKTDCTLAGSDVGSKLAMTQEREVMMIEEQALRVMLQGTSD